MQRGSVEERKALWVATVVKGDGEKGMEGSAGERSPRGWWWNSGNLPCLPQSSHGTAEMYLICLNARCFSTRIKINVIFIVLIRQDYV